MNNLSDFEYYKKITEGKDYTVCAFDGDKKVRVEITRVGRSIRVVQTDEAPSFFSTYKEFFANAVEHVSGCLFRDIKVGIWKYQNNKGKFVKEINEDKKFGNIKPNDIIKFMNDEHLINTETGEGRFNPDGYETFNITFMQPQRSHPIIEFRNTPIWYININPTRYNNYTEIMYIINGDNGEVISRKQSGGDGDTDTDDKLK